MSIHTKVLRVTDEADRLVREFAEQDDIGVYDAATLLILSATPVKKRAESGGPTQADFDAMKADRDRLQVEIEEADEARRAAEERGTFEPTPTPAPDPRVTAYAEERAMSYADALEFMITMADRRIQSLKKYAGKAKAA